MHEMAYLRRIVDAVVDAGERQGAAEVVSVRLVVGELRDFIDKYVFGYFKFLARGTIAQNAEVVLQRVPFTVQCRACGTIYHFDYRDADAGACPTCGAHDFELRTGRELRVDSVVVRGSADHPRAPEPQGVQGKAAGRA
ncbi:MAG: hydrogenase maturation nickel metallochaperone HypA [Coriobacteriales bacterium]|jgi:hydrogenase nickel incorporation protein HypA/HybF